MTIQKTKRTREQVLEEEKELLGQEEALVARKKSLTQREERFFSHFQESLSHVRTISEHYATSPSAQTFYSDFLMQLHRTHSQMADTFEEERQALKKDSKDLDDSLRNLHEEKTRLTYQEEQARSQKIKERSSHND